MSVLQVMNLIVTVAYYFCAVFFLAVTVKVFVKTKKIQDAIIYSVIMIPFILRILRLK